MVDISVQDALDLYIATYSLIEQVDDVPEDLARQREEVVLLEQCRTMYGESVSPEFSGLFVTKKLALQAAEDLLEMKRFSRSANVSRIARAESTGDTKKIHFQCPQCQAKYSALLGQVGKKGKCKKCGGAIEVPNQET